MGEAFGSCEVRGDVAKCVGEKVFDKMVGGCSGKWGDELVQCLGEKIIEKTPPLSHLSQMNDIIDELLKAGFALHSVKAEMPCAPAVRSAIRVS